MMVNLTTFNNGWNPWRIMPQLATIVVTTLIIVTISFLYYRKVKKMKPDDDPRGLVLVVELIIKYIEKIVVDVLGIKYKNLTIYLMYLMLYILIGNWLAIIGLESQATMSTVTISLGLVTFFGIYFVGFKFQKFLFLKRYLNPLELITQFAPLISLSFRLFGNITGGSTILALFYFLTAHIWSHIPIIGQINLLVAVVGWALHSYFDLFAGSIQALIFGILTMVYWKLQMEGDANKPELEIKLPRKLRKLQKENKQIGESWYSERELLDQNLQK